MNYLFNFLKIKLKVEFYSIYSFLIIVLLTLPFSTWANSMCLQTYQLAAFKNLFAISTLLEADSSSIISAREQLTLANKSNESSDKDIEVFNKTIHSAHYDSVKFKNYLDLLAKSKFLLGKSHTLLYLSLHETPEIKSLSQFSYRKRITEILSAKNKLIQSNHPNDEKTKLYMAKDMFNRLLLRLPKNLSNWEKLSTYEKEQENKFDKLTLEMVDALAIILNSPGGEDFIVNLFYLTLPQVHSIATNGTSGKIVNFSTSMAIIAGSTLLGTQMIDNPGNLDIFNSSLFGIFGAGLFASIDSGLNTTVQGGLSRLRHRLFLKKKLQKQFDDLNTQSVSNKLDQQIPEEEQSSFKFSRIKKELETGFDGSLVKIPEWGKQYSEGLSFLLARLDNIKSNLNLINSDTESLYTSKSSKSNKYENNHLSKQKNDMLISSKKEEITALIYRIQLLKLDLMTLSFSLDLYYKQLNEKLIQLSTQHLPDNYTHFAQQKLKEFERQQIILKSFALEIKNLESSGMQMLIDLGELQSLNHSNYFLQN